MVKTRLLTVTEVAMIVYWLLAAAMALNWVQIPAEYVGAFKNLRGDISVRKK